MKRGRLIVATGIAATVALVVAWRVGGSAAQKTPAPTGSETTPQNVIAAAPTVFVSRVIAQPLHRETQLPGELQAFQDVALYPKVQGFVEVMDVDRGSVVTEGQVLAQVVAPELKARRSAAEAKAQAAHAQRLEAEAQLAADETTYQRLKAAAAVPGTVSGNDLNIAQKTATAARARVQAWRDNEQGARDALRSVRDIESYLRIAAPFDGVITERNAHKGSLVGPPSAPGAPPMLRIREVSRLRLTVAIPEADVAGIDLGTEVHFTVPAFPGETFGGAIARAAQALDVKTRTMPVELDVNNSSGRLAPGMYAEVLWPVRRPRPSLFVPPAAVASTTERTFVIRIRDGETEWVDVQRGEAMGNLVEVFGQLQAGDRVAARGTDELRPGTRVIEKDAS
jgi:membrane fusion protein (multidrug efflux system)